ncbi:MAG TPA: cobalt-precorrin 5A hydrolase [Desulfuromonadales bacterium]|nr:cobalt-precorrin 5A hydrolase [Desulfuromonadales bacterium]
MNLAIIAITRNGARLGARLQNMAVDADLFVAEKFVTEAGVSARPFAGELRELVRANWRKYQGFVFIMATGIVVRVIAPHLQAKDRDPAVVVVDEAGSFAISLLSGHLGGANELTRDVAELLGGQAVITTATDVNELPSFDLMAKEEGWVIDDLDRVKSLNALLLAGEEIAVVDPSGRVAARFAGRGRLSIHANFVAALESGAAGFVFVTNRQLPPQAQAGKLLVLRPKNLALGIGCNRETSAGEIAEVVGVQLKQLFLSLRSIAVIGTAAAKREEAGLLAFAGEHGIPLRFFESHELNAVAVPSPPSAHALGAIGAIGVAEPAALLAAGSGRLLLKKVKSGNVTLAVAEILET